MGERQKKKFFFSFLSCCQALIFFFFIYSHKSSSRTRKILLPMICLFISYFFWRSILLFNLMVRVKLFVAKFLVSDSMLLLSLLKLKIFTKSKKGGASISKSMMSVSGVTLIFMIFCPSKSTMQIIALLFSV